MAWTFVDSEVLDAGYGTNGSETTDNSLAVSAGDLVIVAGAADGSSNTIDAIADSEGNSYTLLTQVSSSNAHQRLGYSVITTGSATMTWTVDYTGGGLRYIMVLVFRPDGGDTVALDVDVNVSGYDTTLSTTAGNSTGDDAVAAAFGFATAERTWSSEQINDVAADATIAGGDNQHRGWYSILSSADASVDADGTVNTVVSFLIQLVIFKATAGGSAYQETITDTVGLTDTITTARALAKSVSENAGITDSLATSRNIPRSFGNSTGITDTLATARNMPRSFSDSVGISDSISVIKKLVKIITDALGITDAIANRRELSRSVSETAGLTDTTAQARDLARNFADTAAATDETTTARGIVKSIADSIGITDALSRVRGFFRSITDALGLTDTTAAEVAEGVAATPEILLLSGSIDRQLDLSGSIDRQLDISGSITRTVSISGQLRN